MTDTLIASHVLTWRKSTERERFSRLSDRHTDCMACLDLEKEHTERDSADSVTDTLIAWHVLTWRKSTEREIQQTQ